MSKKPNFKRWLYLRTQQLTKDDDNSHALKVCKMAYRDTNNLPIPERYREEIDMLFDMYLSEVES